MHQHGWVVSRGWVGLSASTANATGTSTPLWTYDGPEGDFLMSRYFAAFFAAMTDMAIENASTEIEMLVACMNHLFYECLYGFVLGTLTSIVLESRKSAREYEEKLADVREFCSMNKVSTIFQQYGPNHLGL